MNEYAVHVRMIQTLVYYVEAENEEDARREALSGNCPEAYDICGDVLGTDVRKMCKPVSRVQCTRE